MKVVLDAVFNHTEENFCICRYHGKAGKSKYLDWYFIERFPLKVKKEKLLTSNVLVIMRNAKVKSEKSGG